MDDDTQSLGLVSISALCRATMATLLWIIGIVTVVWPVLVSIFIDKTATENVNELESEVKAGFSVVELILAELQAEISTIRSNKQKRKATTVGLRDFEENTPCTAFPCAGGESTSLRLLSDNRYLRNSLRCQQEKRGQDVKHVFPLPVSRDCAGAEEHSSRSASLRAVALRCAQPYFA